MTETATLHNISPGPAPLQTQNALRKIANKYQFDDGAVLIQIPQVPPELIEGTVARNRGYFAYPPQGLFYLSAAFRELGIETAIVDLNFEMLRGAQDQDVSPDQFWRNSLDKTLATFTAPFICVSFMFDSTYGQLIEVCQHIKKARPDLCIAVGGVAATADPERILRRGLADLIFANEGELPLAKFYKYLRDNDSPQPPNLSFLDPDDQTFCETQKVTGSEIDWDIRQEYQKVPLGDYSTIGSLTNFSRMRGIDVPYATIISRRGCRARCTFCSVRNFNGKSVRVRDTNGVVEEMLYLRETFGIEHFNWLDDDLLYDQTAALHLFQSIAERLPGITWDANNGLIASAVTPDLFGAMRASGCIGFTVGLETGNAEILRQVKKPATIERFRAFADRTKEFPGMFYTVNFILGLPEERFEQALDSFDLAMDVKLNWNNFFMFQPLKNTDIHTAYGGMADDISEEELIRRGTTINYNAARSNTASTLMSGESVLSGYDVFNTDPILVPGTKQRTEMWFTFNYITNFLRNPALTSDEDSVVDLAVRWFGALGQAYADNPTIDCMAYFLKSRKGDLDQKTLDTIRKNAERKFAESGYWKVRDEQFQFSSLLDNVIPDLDPRAKRQS